MQQHRSHVALYGRVAIQREYCKACATFSFVLDGKRVCCNQPAEAKLLKKYKRVAAPEQVRRLPPKAERDAQLAIQENRCFYCGWEFGRTVVRNLRTIQLKLNWDHQVPYAFSQNNAAYNFVAACHICNGIKSDLVFRTVEEAQIYILGKREAKGYV